MIAIGNDHAGLGLKKEIISYLTKNGIEYKDFGTNTDSSVDYPDYALNVANSILSGNCSRGILICGTGIGISIAANKIPGIRAALCTNSYMAKLSREHNDSNILALGERVIGPGLVIDILESWLNTSFLGARHQNRLNKIIDIEKNYNQK